MSENAVARPGALPRALPLALAGAAALAVAIGIGRFGQTAVAPIMIREGSLGAAACAGALSAHFGGYALGALLLARMPRPWAGPLAAAGLAATVLLLAAAGLAGGGGGLAGVRFLSGVASGVVMVAASTWLFQAVGTAWAPVLYGGAGLGVALAAEACAAAGRAGLGGCAAWMVLAALAAVLAVPAAAATLRPRAPTPAADGRREAPDLSPAMLVALYAAGGFGYVVAATYLPAIVARGLPGLDPVHLFALFGLAAIPSCWFWLRIDARVGTRRALACNYALQVAGTALPAVVHHPAAGALAAILVGGTFMGVVALAMSAGRRHAGAVRYNLMAALTAAYAIGQLAGPMVAGWVLSRGGGLDRPLLMASATLLAGCIAALLPGPDRAGRTAVAPDGEGEAAYWAA